MKIAYICNFSYPFWEGVWNNVYHLAKHMLKQGHEVHVFTSNINPSGNNFSNYDSFEGIHIHRFPVKRKIGDYGLFFDFENELSRINPDIIHAHVYRNPGAHKALTLAKKLHKPCFLTTHAPFSRNRKLLAKWFVNFYDSFYGKRILNQYHKVIAITKWELPFLFELGLKRDKLVYIPNGVSKDFFIKPKRREKIRNAIYLGRVSKIKNLGAIIKIAERLPNLKFKIIGPLEKDYYISSRTENLEIISKKFNQKEEIKLLKDANIYILPSISEGFPQTLLEAMAAGKIVFSSRTKGALEVVKDDKNGFIFYNLNDLFRKIKYCEGLYFKASFKIKTEAQKTAKNFLWENIAKQTEQLYEESIVP